MGCTREPQKVLQEQPHSDSHQKSRTSGKSAASEPQIDSMGTSWTVDAKPPAPSKGVDNEISPGSDSPHNLPSPYPDPKGPDSNPVLSAKKPNDARASVLSKILYLCVSLLTTVMI